MFSSRTIDSLCQKDKAMVLRIATVEEANAALRYHQVTPGDYVRARQLVGNEQVMEALQLIDILPFEHYAELLQVSGLRMRKFLRLWYLSRIRSSELLNMLTDDYAPCIDMVIEALGQIVFIDEEDMSMEDAVGVYVQTVFPGASHALGYGMEMYDYYDLMRNHKLKHNQIMDIAESLSPEGVLDYKSARDSRKTHNSALKAALKSDKLRSKE